jgi:hypothetical protein
MPTTENGVKQRFDGKGSEFGNVHRLLPPRCGMFDIDKMKAKAVVDLEVTKQDIGFIEYRTLWNKSDIKWMALFEIKYMDSDTVKKLMECKLGTATWAQMKLCQQLNMRYFIVIATEGCQPFDFYEVFDTGNYEHVGTLDYGNEDKKGKINEFWTKIGLIEKFNTN